MAKDLLWTYKFKQHKDVKDKVIEMITKYSAKSGAFDKNSGTHMYSDYFIKDGNREYGEELLPFLQDFMQQLLEKTGCGNVRYFYWCQQYVQRGQHSWHNHPNCSLSGVYYLKLEDGKDATEFFDPVSKTKFQPDVEEGDIVVFPSYLPHRSKFINSDREKIIVSFNFNFDVDYSDPIFK